MEFDDSWIDNYEKDIRVQEKRMRIVKVFYFYINSDNEIKKVNQNSIEIKDGVLNRDELLKLIVLNRQKHKLTQILKYIVTSVDENTDFKTFMTPNNLSDISFLDSPKIFESVNSLFFFFEEDEKKSIFHRLFAPTVAHTTSAKGRSCKSCHSDPLAIGFGRGELIYDADGYWSFQNKYALDLHDNLPEDAWIGFLTDKQGKSTRIGARPFTIVEQKKILTVGACLTCHDDDSKVMLESLKDFDELLKIVSIKCLLPKWD